MPEYGTERGDQGSSGKAESTLVKSKGSQLAPHVPPRAVSDDGS